MTTLSRRAFLTAGGAALLAVPARATASGPTSLITWTEVRTEQGAEFGGFSGLELSADRSRMIAISDRGFVVRADLIRDPSGRLTEARETSRFDLTGRNGQILRGGAGDAEGLDWDGGNQIDVAFEGGRLSRVTRYSLRGPQISQLRRDPRWRALHVNSTLEALAVDPQGRAVVIPESPTDRGFALYRQNGADWTIIGHLEADGPFRPVGADFGPDGALYLLERKFRVAFFGTRISRIDPAAWNRRQVLVETGYGVLDNHEGLSITLDTNGRLWATTISDDNQNRFQRTEIAEFLLRP